MARVLPSSWPRIASILALAMVFLVLGAGAAAAKPKVAVLGIEVTGTIDQTSTSVAHDLTEGLRNKAKQTNGPYQFAPNSDKELIDEKVLKNCDSEGPLCMSDIGKELGADILIYGRLERDGGGYKATLHVLDVKNKSPLKSMTIPVPGGSGTDANRSIAKKAYSELIGGGGGGGIGTIVVKANVDSGTVFIDDEQKETLSDGTATVTLPEGRYRVAVESTGRSRKEISVTVTANESTTQRFELGAPGGGGSKGNVWKPVFGVTLGVAVALGAFSGYEYLKQRDDRDSIQATRADGPGHGSGALGDGDCNTSNVATDPGGFFQSACDHHTKHLYSGIAAIVVGAGAIGFGYMAFFHSNKEATTSSSRRATPRSEVAITPVISPNSGGALVYFTW